jgi:diguanylate cyclase (GGDEF)-like protein/PAS domain S-box-containing protein
MDIDIQTLALVLSLSSLLQAIALYAQYRLDKAHPGLGWWTAGSALFAVGFTFNTLTQIPTIGPIALVMHTVALVSGMALLQIGVMRLLGQREPQRLLIALFGLAVLIALYFTVVDDEPVIRQVNISVATAALSFMMARALFAHRMRAVSAVTSFLGGIFVANGLLMALQALSQLADPTGHILSRTLTQSTIYLGSLLFSTLWTFGFIILVNQRLNAKMRGARDNLELIFNTSPDAVLITRLRDGQIAQVNESFSALTGFTPHDVIGRSTMDIEFWDEPVDRLKTIATLREKGTLRNLEVNFRRRDGQPFLGLMSARLIDLQGVPHLLSMIRDISERKIMEEALRASETRCQLLAEHVNDVIWTLSLDGRFAYISPSVQQMLGFAPEDLLDRALEAVVSPSSRGIVRDAITHVMTENNGDQHQTVRCFEIELPCKDGGTRWLEATLRLRVDKEGRPVELVGATRDISEQKRLKDELQRQAITDELTGVHNRRHFLTLAQLELKRTLRRQRTLALALIDIDRFKVLNDTYGHAAGDQALLALTRFCRNNLRAIDVFARFGGDEFVLLLPESNQEEAFLAVERIRATLASEPIMLDDNRVFITISAGVSCLEDSETSLDGLLRRADRALFQMKRAGRNRVGFAHDAR